MINILHAETAKKRRKERRNIQKFTEKMQFLSRRLYLRDHKGRTALRRARQEKVQRAQRYSGIYKIVFLK